MVILVILLLLLQYPLWLGKGGWLKVADMSHQVEDHKQENQRLRDRNASLDADVSDLKQGTEAFEERARSELGMIKHNEVFYQVIRPQDTESAHAQSAVLEVKPVKVSRH
jgi:cell division protein FtsB